MASSARIDELRKKFDENPRRYFAPLANEYRKAGDFEQAIFICQEYLPQQPGHMSGHIVFGQALFEAKRLPEARTVFETALTLDPENLIALRHLADISRALGDTAVARGWYERVLQADPRNEEIAAIMSSMAASATTATSSPTAPTAESPAAGPVTPASKPAVAPPAAGSPSAPTVELSAAAVQEMLRARQAVKNEQVPLAKTLDEAPTVELTLPPAPSAMEGLEPTSHTETHDAPAGGLLDIPSGGLLDALPEAATLDVPTGGLLGLEPTAAAPPPPSAVPEVAPAEGLDSLSLEDFSLQSTPPPSATPKEVGSTAPETTAEEGLLDLDSFEIGGEAPSPTPAQAPESPAPVASTGVSDGGHAATIDFDFEVPTPTSNPDSVPTLVVNPIEEVAPEVTDILQETVAAVVDIVDEAPPAVPAAVTRAPTVMTDQVPVNAPVEASPPLEEPGSPPATQQVAVAASPTAGVTAPRAAYSEEAQQAAPPSLPPERSASAFVTETMAQLYLEQGHRAEAIDIYRQLVAVKPNDADLRARLEAIERGSASRAPQTAEINATSSNAVAASPQANRTQRFTSSGPTIRSVLRDLLGIDATASRPNGRPGTSQDGELGSIDVLFSAKPEPDALNPLAVAFDGGYVAPPGSIDAVFAGENR